MLSLLSLAQAPSRSAAGDEAAREFFEKSVRPVLVEHCLKCHGPDKQKGGLRLDSREAALAGGDGGPAIVAGKPGDSPLVSAVRHEELEMPPGKKLAADQIAALTKWVADGAVWPSDGKPTMGKQSSHQTRKPGVITDEDRAWWAFQTPKRPALPAAGGDWAITPIDRFVAKRLESEGFSHAAEADRRTLIRRVSLDLTGLPPTPEEVEAFAADPAPDAYAKLVDRLLASPRYGERWGRLWLDLVRYAESDGYRLDEYRPHAWRYRDYVIRSLNADKGYDRFVREQLAGDELYPDDPDARVATGFLRLWPYEYNQKDARTQLAAIHNDITDVTADAILGLGFQCARCHDHKFDPILQKDYFSLQSFFAGVRFADEPVFDSPAAKAEYDRDLAAWEAKTADVRKKLDALLKPAQEKAAAGTTSRFPPDVQVILNKPAGDRTPSEQQLAELALIQIRYFAERDAAKKIPAGQKAEYDRLKKELDALAAGKPAEPVAEVVRDLGPVAAETVIPGGRKKTVAVGPTFPGVLGGSEPSVTPRSDSTSRRAALAEWLTRPDHPLTARVMANRVWQHHFGKGIVATPSDYGTLGEKPSHPELLDWLTVEFVENGWSLKHLHRLIVTSAVYRQCSTGQASPAAATKDPENRLLWRMPVRRMDAEQVRDAMLAASGELDPTAGGPSVPAAKPRRSVYTRQVRNSPDALLASFDAADGLASCPARNVTVTPTQSLLLLNGAGPLARAAAFAKRVMPSDGKDAPAGVEMAFRLAYGRPPTTEEQAEALSFLRRQLEAVLAQRPGAPRDREARLSAWADFCHALLNSNEFLYVD